VINNLVSKAMEFYNYTDFIIILTDANVIFKNDLVSFLVQPFFFPDISLVDSKIEPLSKVSKGISISENFYLNRETLLKQNEGKWKGLSMGASGGCYAIRSNDYVPVSLRASLLNKNNTNHYQVLKPGSKRYFTFVCRFWK
jgi:hypothetical protein